MNFNLKNDQQEMFDLALKFAKNEMIPVAREHDEKETFPKAIIEKAWELGFVNTCLPTEVGGNGFGLLDAVTIGEALSYGCMGMYTSIMCNDLALTPIVIGGSTEQKEKFLKPFTEKPILASFCLTEPGSGSDAAGLKTTIKDNGDHYLLNGSKMWITNAGYADLLLVYCTIDPNLKHKGICALVVPAHLEGITLGKKEEKMGQRCSDTRSVQFENVKVPKENLLGKEGDGWKIAMKTLDHSRPLVSSIALGGARRAIECATEYAKERKQFGVPIAKHQAIQFMLADMTMKLDASRLLVQKAAWQADEGIPNTRAASAGKAMAADSCMQITTDAVQIFGGYGYSREYPVEKLMRDAKLIQIYEGTSQIQRLVIAKDILGK
ncbi:MAG: acyl-CoA dehydrogenase [Halobacteriovoraceae bacterium]|nr:acyl-CoA dehydrogenase [Halobacteriovoraceae bacterium]|tara:strand:+ start:14719 stop:15858 length:1140 start_codon:yes stop_codon:yes gene_type:complete